MLAVCFSYSRVAVISGLICFLSAASATTFVIPGPVTPPIVPVLPPPVTPVPVVARCSVCGAGCGVFFGNAWADPR